MTAEDALKVCKARAMNIQYRDVMEANCHNFTELADKMADAIVFICDNYKEIK